ncbi:TIGR03084 family metal-binding protein [uncultured Nocardioides sp.]|uniref:TIGR03084 family metal-binding protein n=1 Tax=uncultured Nocardioides sp. TaxID=198441 RepID=UPI00261062E8|nr:TIGR03084 family metal-binding protein [uncultured Nocardioides sp.]
MSVLEEVLADLAAESDALDARVHRLADDASGWRRTTPAAGWTVAHQVAHLAWTDEVATLAARAATGEKDPWDEVVLGAMNDPDGFVDAAAADGAAVTADDLRARWLAAREGLATALRDLPDGTRMPWFGPPMSPTSMATARFMETWTHAQDVHEALGAPVAPTDRIRHVAHLGVRTRRFAYAAHGLDAPEAEVRVELVAPSGEVWTWGPEDATQRVTGPAYDFCLRVTQRRPRSALALVAEGPDAERWLDVAQCFAGPPGAGSGARP